MSTLERILVWLGQSDHSGKRCGRDRGNLAGDKSGAIALGGVFMSVLLAAGVFYIIGTGNAIIYRERLQDAADAAAYTSAGVHARGMNLIVLINLIMAALLAVLIMLRMIVLMLGITIVACGICTAACIFCPLCPVCGPALTPMGQLEIRLANAANKYSKMLEVILPALSKLQVVIALGTPWVGFAKGNGVIDFYKPMATGGLTASPSMVPLLPDGKRIALPVEEMAYSKFCGKSAELMMKYGFGWTGPGISTVLGAFAKFVTKTFSGYFCGSDKGNMQQVLQNKFDEMIKDSCNDQKKDCETKGKDPPGTYPKCTGTAADEGTNCISEYCCAQCFGLNGDFNTANCVKDGKKAAADKQAETGFNGNNPQGGPGGKGEPSKPATGVAGLFKWQKTPKDLWSGAEHGGFWFQTFAVTKGDGQFPRKMDKGVSIATWGGAQMPKVDAGWGNWRLAQAEFYFDQGGKWSKVKDGAMWSMFWRARLRRFSISGLNVAGMIGGKLMDQLWTKIGGKLGNILAGKSGSIIFTSGAQGLFDTLSKQVTSLVGDWVTKPIDGAIDSYVMPSWEIIH